VKQVWFGFLQNMPRRLPRRYPWSRRNSRILLSLRSSGAVMFQHPVADDPGLPFEALFSQLAPQLGSVMTSLLPPLFQVFAITIERAFSAPKALFWKAV